MGDENQEVGINLFSAIAKFIEIKIHIFDFTDEQFDQPLNALAEYHAKHNFDFQIVKFESKNKKVFPEGFEFEFAITSENGINVRNGFTNLEMKCAELIIKIKNEKLAPK